MFYASFPPPAFYHIGFAKLYFIDFLNTTNRPKRHGYWKDDK